MPGFNQKGPIGQGSMTGRRMGRCTNFGETIKAEASSNVDAEVKKSEETEPVSFPGRGLGFGHGRGRGGAGRGMGRQNRCRGGL